MSHSDRQDILVVGGGGREHALAWRIRQSPLCGRLFCAPGNPGIAGLPGVTCVPIDPGGLGGPEAATGIRRLCELVRREHIDLVVVGPEAPLRAGLRDALLAEGGERTAVFGCSARAAEIEASKVFAKGFMRRHSIPTAAYTVATTPAQAGEFLAAEARAGRTAWVVKADGLWAGKGVTLCDTPDEALAAARLVLARGEAVVIEERLAGREASCMALCDGEHVVMLPPCEDHKTIGESDTGPMTGGMGAICPTPVVSAALLQQVREQVLVPAARGLAMEGRPFHGLLYAGIMCTASGPQVLEFNCRFGDPETQPLMMLLGDDLVPLLGAVGRHRLAEVGAVSSLPGAAVCVVLAAAGYPGPPRTGDPITGIDRAEQTAPGQVTVFHAGTALRDDGAGGAHLLTGGGRVLGVTARADSLAAARGLAYAAAAEIHFEGACLRRDIGARGLVPEALSRYPAA